MKAAVLGLCVLCMIGAFFEQLHGGGRYEPVLRLAFGMYLLTVMCSLVKSMI